LTALGLAAALLWAPARAAGQTIVGAEAVEKYNRDPLTVQVPSGLPPQAVEEVMASTLQNRKWTVVERSPQQVVGTLVHRGFDAKVVLKVEGNLIKILNESSYKSPQTGQSEPAIPKGWLRNLEKDLKVFLAKKASQG
jgi:hypothetical protein